MMCLSQSEPQDREGTDPTPDLLPRGDPTLQFVIDR